MNSIEILATKHNKSMHLMFATFFLLNNFNAYFAILTAYFMVQYFALTDLISEKCIRFGR